MSPAVAVVTDSTAYLPEVPGVSVVPVQVISGDRSWDEPDLTRALTGATRTRRDTSPGGSGSARATRAGLPSGAQPAPRDLAEAGGDAARGDRAGTGGDATPGDPARAGGGCASLAWGDLATATTSRPAPERFASCYAALTAQGAAAVVSVHLSGELSGTVEAARAAAREAPLPVTVVDSRSIGMGLGFPVLAAARAAAEGGDPEAVARAAAQCAARTRTLFYVDTLDQLRRGGRIGAAASLVGTALMIKPLLRLTDGRIALLEKVRTASRALARLEDLVVQDAGGEQVEIAVQHLAAPERAETLARDLAKRVRGVTEVRVMEVGAVIGVHVGPGMLGITIAPAS
ncbi:DegV family protein [Nonomuraea sp. CA-218870]|uniref:DegV family protein n=1 Tax=Nonomuraea sp. CA-218870 TaxID=3239998 RepID=UPI003D8E8AC2